MVIFNSYVSLPEGIFTTSIRKNPVARGSGIRGSSPHLTVPSDRCGGLGLHRLRCNLESVTMNESCLKKCPILSILYHFISFYPCFSAFRCVPICVPRTFPVIDDDQVVQHLAMCRFRNLGREVSDRGPIDSSDRQIWICWI
jgi:hypothetical protein